MLTIDTATVGAVVHVAQQESLTTTDSCCESDQLLISCDWIQPMGLKVEINLPKQFADDVRREERYEMLLISCDWIQPMGLKVEINLPKQFADDVRREGRYRK